jgi:hypothetical protein
MARQRKDAYAALIGLDWVDQKHDYCLGVGATQTVALGTIEARPEAVAD